MTYDLTLQEDRIKAFEQLENDCKEAFIKAGFEAAPGMVLTVDRTRITIGIKNTDKQRTGWTFEFGSEVEFSSKDQKLYHRDNQINFGMSGAFTPENKASYWRTIHAASILKNWEALCTIVNEYCSKCKELENEINKTDI